MRLTSAASLTLSCAVTAFATSFETAASICPAEQAAPLVPTDLALCSRLESVVRRPAALPLDQYETQLGVYLRNFCHRNPAAGWVRDRRLRDTGPFTATLANGV